jgi:hypothetical protein
MRASPLVSLAFAASLSASLAGCTVAVDTESNVDDLSASSRTYVTLRRDTRKCAAPMCGGFWIRDANKTTKERYVSGLDFSLSGLSESDIDIVNAAPPEELVLRGKLGPIESTFDTRPFLVSEAFIGMPGQTAEDGATFYLAKDHDPPIQCFAAPCNNGIATKLNTTQKTPFTSYAVDKAAATRVDQVWLTDRVETRGAIVAAKIRAGQKYPAGTEQVLDASQVYVKLPLSLGPCGKPYVPSCPTGQVPTFKRGVDRCTTFDSCVKPGVCPQYVPACDDGYMLVSYTSAPLACNAYVCDPDFLFQ